MIQSIQTVLVRVCVRSVHLEKWYHWETNIHGKFMRANNANFSQICMWHTSVCARDRKRSRPIDSIHNSMTPIFVFFFWLYCSANIRWLFFCFEFVVIWLVLAVRLSVLAFGRNDRRAACLRCRRTNDCVATSQTMKFIYIIPAITRGKNRRIVRLIRLREAQQPNADVQNAFAVRPAHFKQAKAKVNCVSGKWPECCYTYVLHTLIKIYFVHAFCVVIVHSAQNCVRLPGPKQHTHSATNSTHTHTEMNARSTNGKKAAEIISISHYLFAFQFYSFCQSN